MTCTKTAHNEETNADTVEVDGTTYFRLGETENATDIEGPVVADDFEFMFFEASRPITDEELYHLSGLLGYLWRVHVKGARLDDVRRNDEKSFEIYAPLTSSRSSNRYARFDDFVLELNDFIASGSTVKQDGTQKVKGMENLTLTVFVDTVTQELERENFFKNSKMAKLAAKPSPFAPERLSGKTTEEIVAKVQALVTIKNSLTPGEQDILTMAHDLIAAQYELAAKVAEAEEKLEAIRSALS